MKKSLLAFILLLPFFASAHEGHGAAKSFPRPPEREISVEAQPWVQNCVAEPYLVADFIYWKVRQDGLQYAVKGIEDTGNPVTTKGKIYEPDFGGEPGFRVGLGLNLAHDGWDLLLKYTWLYASADDRISGGLTDDTIRPFWTHSLVGFLNGGVTRATSEWDLRMNVLDLEWGRNYYISRFLTLRPFFGFKGFWSKEDFNVRYRGLVLSQAGDNVVGSTLVHLNQDTWGFGIRFGTNTAWYFARNWSAYADLALTAAWSRYDLDRRDRGVNHSTNGETLLMSIGYDRYTMTPIMELGVGLRWEMWFNDDSYHALIQAGWEEQIWWDFNRFFHIFQPNAMLGNLQFQGLTLKFRFDF
ncbi:MAG: MOMP family protein [Chlamydiia bacterium]|nr:MOMP family protein [Chlamydiia bacterium]